MPPIHTRQKNNLDIFAQFFYSEMMLDVLITSKTRIKLITRFFLNPGVSSYLRELASEFGESTNGIKQELERLTEAGLLCKRNEGRVVRYFANKDYPLFAELVSIVRKYFGIDRIEDEILSRLGNVEAAYITGDYARGIDSGVIDLVVVGEIDEHYLQNLVNRAEDMVKRKIRTLVISRDELEDLKQSLELEKGILLVG